MANLKSAIKRNKQSLVRRERNRVAKSTLKTVAKKVETALAEKNADSANEALKTAIVAFDKAAGKGIIHSKTASRKISRLTKKVNSIAA